MKTTSRDTTEKIPAVPAIFLAWDRRSFSGQRVGGFGGLLLLVVMLSGLLSLAPVMAQENGAGVGMTYQAAVDTNLSLDLQGGSGEGRLQAGVDHTF